MSQVTALRCMGINGWVHWVQLLMLFFEGGGRLETTAAQSVSNAAGVPAAGS